MGRTLPAPRTASSGLAAAGATWVGAHRALLALRALLVSFVAPLPTIVVTPWRWEEKFPAWPETLYVGMASGPQTLVEGVQLLCQVLVSAKQTQIQGASPVAPGRVAAAGLAGHHAGNGERPADGCERPPSAAALHLARWRTRWIWSSKALPMGWQCLATGCWRGESTWNPARGSPVGNEERTECPPAWSPDHDPDAVLQTVLECIELWGGEDSGVGQRLIGDLRTALEDLDAARSRTRIVALRCVAVCIRSSQEVQAALASPRTAPIPVDNGGGGGANAMEVEGGDIAGVSTTGGVDVARLRVLIQSWEAVVEAQLKDAKRRLSKASKVARELRLEGYATVDVAAATEAAIATSAINCDDAVRRALVLLAMFAGSARRRCRWEGRRSS